MRERGGPNGFFEEEGFPNTQATTLIQAISNKYLRSNIIIQTISKKYLRGNIARGSTGCGHHTRLLHLGKTKVADHYLTVCIRAETKKNMKQYWANERILKI